MKWIIGIVALLVLVILTTWLIGRSLPVAHTATVTRTIPETPGHAWQLVSDLERWRDWRSDLKSLQPVDEDRFEIVDQYGKVVYRIERPGDRTLVTIIDSEGLPYGGSWTWTIRDAGQGAARITITENGEVYNPFFRFMARFVFGHDATMNAVLDQLEAYASRG